MEALADAYNAVTPALPRLFSWELPVEANRPAIPYALLIQAPGNDEIQTQGAAGAGVGAGTTHEVLLVRFVIWTKDAETADAAASALTDALTPKCLTVTGAICVLQVLDTNVQQERPRAARLGAKPIPRGRETDVARVYSSTCDVKVRIVYR